MVVNHRIYYNLFVEPSPLNIYSVNSTGLVEFVQNYPQGRPEIKLSPVIGFRRSNGNLFGLTNIQLWKMNLNKLA
ncbi:MULTISPECIES: hypothetical protein [unclassified Moorena]|uniref:hypothetical protein n=1 Tax=unclassified Moorena TaxID=2683338 RepID=UPI0013FF94A3|nr:MULTISPECIES: hypothetical protein [unclassified Moorena]NEO15753.1 hypothetical protein [Moorena sp. SIO3E8]NEQ02200.1 hypothetical protein [Moorena sp. SIO3F7]